MAEVAADLCGAVCELSDDHWHHADEHDYIRTYELSDGNYIEAKCKYCHKQFVGGPVTPDSLSDAYSDYVNTLPAQGYDSAGTLLWQPRWSDTLSSAMTFEEFQLSDKTVRNEFNVSGDLSDSTFFSYTSSLDTTSSRRLILRNAQTHYFRAPISGKYTYLNTSTLSKVFWRNSAGDVQEWKTGWSIRDYSKVVVAGNGVGLSFASSSLLCSPDFIQCQASIYTPIYSIEPYDDTDVTNNYYISTRVNNFNGDYYDSVTNNYYNNTTIVNETTNNYYDMTTNNNYTMSNWSYDYASRTYFITLEDGTTVTVQFGDDCMTITKNDVTNSYQYVIKNNGGSDPDTPTTCKHDWQETIDTAPTCLEGGHASYTCSLCGETYEQILSAKGHNWTVAEHVNTVYGENGEVVTQGHTLYQCSVCGEQWYTDTGAPPPDVSGSSNILAWLQSFQTWLDEKLDSLFSAADAVIVTKLDALIEKSSDTIVNVIEDDTYIPNVFYLDESNGAVDTTKDGISLFADLVRWLWTNVFDGAFDAADITKLDGLFYDPAAAAEEVPDGS